MTGRWYIVVLADLCDHWSTWCVFDMGILHMFIDDLMFCKSSHLSCPKHSTLCTVPPPQSHWVSPLAEILRKRLIGNQTFLHPSSLRFQKTRLRNNEKKYFPIRSPIQYLNFSQNREGLSELLLCRDLLTFSVLCVCCPAKGSWTAVTYGGGMDWPKV